MRSIPAVLAVTILGAFEVAPAQVPADAEAVVRDWDAAFRLVEDSELLRRGDFNGDGREDVVAVVTDGTRSVLVVLQSGPDGWSAVPLFTRMPPGRYLLRVVPPGHHRILGPEGTIRTSTDSIELVFPGRASALYVRERGGYRVYGTENYY